MSEQSPGGQPEQPDRAEAPGRATEPGPSPAEGQQADHQPTGRAGEHPQGAQQGATQSATQETAQGAQQGATSGPAAEADDATPKHGIPQLAPSDHGQQAGQGPQGGQPGYQPYFQPQPMAPVQSNLPHYAAQQGAPRSRRRSWLGTALIALIAGLIGGVLGGGLAARSGPVGGYAPNAPNALDTPPPVSTPHTPLPAGTIEQVAQKVLPTVVQIQFVSANGSGEGSGVVLSSDGMILTNNHVVEAGAQGAKLTAAFQDGRKAPIMIIGRAPDADLAVVQAQGVSGLPAAELGSSSGLVVGQQVVAIGSPFELAGTVTSGIVSALQRPARVGGESGNQSTVLDTVQTDAAINPGNSGGPLVDMQGKVVAINSAIYSPNSGGLGSQQQGGSVGVGFAIPIDQARRIADQLRRDGKATVAVLNVKVTPNGPAQIIEVVPGGPGDKAGMKAGDVVAMVGDRRIETADGLIAAIRSHSPGETVTLALTDSAGGNAHTVQATLGSQDIGATK